MLTDLFYSIHRFQIAGYGVFAVRAFKQDEIVLRSWMTLFLPINFPNSEVVHNYVFDHNKTHCALVLDYGSVMNHHESPNMLAVRVGEKRTKTQNENVYFQVRKDFQFANRMFEKHVARTHSAYPCTQTHPRPQKPSRLDRKFFLIMATRIGLEAKTYRTPMSTTRAQCGGRISTRCHIAENLLTEPWMANTSSLFSTNANL